MRWRSPSSSSSPSTRSRKHVTQVTAKLRIPASTDDHRRVLAVLDVPGLGPSAAAMMRGAMEPRISIVTLGVADLARAKAFYEQLGWHGQEVEETVFVQAGALALVLWGRDKLAADCGLQAGCGTPSSSGSSRSGFGGIVLAQNVRSREEVDAIVAAAAAAGATVTRPPAETFYGGYAGVFTDPDGHAWEIAHNPGFALAEDGALTIAQFPA